MKFWTGHIRPDSEPVLVREGFAWGALLFGPFWLAAHRAWIPAALALAAYLLILALAAGDTAAVLILALAVWLGTAGHDLCCWSLRQRGFILFVLVAANDETGAFGKMLERRPDLAGRFMPPGCA